MQHSGKRGGVLYISYDGALDPLGQSQVVPYLKRLSREGFDVFLLTFEKKASLLDEKEVCRLERMLCEAGVRWYRLQYHKRPSILATAYDVVAGVVKALVIIWRSKAAILHARSYVAALMGLIVKRIRDVALVFDMRGFWVDERVDGGLWKRNSRIYRIAKSLEKRFFLESDGIVSLTQKGLAAINEIQYMKDAHKPSVVIPTCVDLDVFQAVGTRAKRAAGLNDRFVVGYLGSLGTWYLFDEMIDFFLYVKGQCPGSFFYLVSNTDRHWIHGEIAARSIEPSDYRIDHVSREEVPRALSTFDVSIFFYKDGWSRRGTCPTKLGESLACGVPVIASAGIGDVDEIVTKHRVGVIVKEMSQAAYEVAWREVRDLLDEEEEMQRRCRAVAEEYFSLAKGVEGYAAFYDRVLKRAV